MRSFAAYAAFLLALAPKSKVHVRSMMSQLFEYAIWADVLPLERNPMTLVVVREASKRIRKPAMLSIDDFHRFVSELSEPYRTMVIVAACLGLRISEVLRLQ